MIKKFRPISLIDGSNRYIVAKLSLIYRFRKTGLDKPKLSLFGIVDHSKVTNTLCYQDELEYPKDKNGQDTDWWTSKIIQIDSKLYRGLLLEIDGWDNIEVKSIYLDTNQAMLESGDICSTTGDYGVEPIQVNSVTINDGAIHTSTSSVTVKWTASKTPTHYEMTVNSVSRGWKTYATSETITLAEQGISSVCIRVKDATETSAYKCSQIVWSDSSITVNTPVITKISEVVATDVQSDYLESYRTMGNTNGVKGVNMVNSGATLATGINGESNGAYYFDGTTYMQSNTGHSISGGSWSISMWLSFDVNNQPNDYPFVIGVANDVSVQGRAGLRVKHAGTLSFNFYDSGDRTFTAINLNQTKYINKWMHIGLVFNESDNTVKLYIDGVLAQSLGNGTIVWNNFQIGRSVDGGTSWNYRGSVAKVRLYGRVLTQANLEEIRTFELSNQTYSTTNYKLRMTQDQGAGIYYTTNDTAPTTGSTKYLQEIAREYNTKYRAKSFFAGTGSNEAVYQEASPPVLAKVFAPYTFPSQANIVAYWKLNESLDDASGNSNSLTQIGTTGWTNGKFDKGAYTNSSGGKLTHTLATPLVDNYSISMWIKTGSGTSYNFYTQLEAVGVFRCKDKSLNVGASVLWSDGTPNKWTHIVAIKEAGKVKIWANGIKQVNEATDGDTLSTIEIVEVSHSNFWSGQSIDDVVVFNIVLPEQSIRDIYAGGNGINLGGGTYNLSMSHTLGSPIRYEVETTVVDDHLSYWRLRGNVMEETCRNQLDIVNASLTTGITGLAGTAYYLDGSVDFPIYAQGLDSYNVQQNPFSISVWVNPEIQTTNYPSIVSCNHQGGFNTGTNAYGLRYSNTGQTGKFSFHWKAEGDPAMVTTSTYSANNWYHLVVTRTGSSLKMYVNGTEVASKTIADGSAINLGSGNLIIGGSFDTTNGRYKGKVCNLRIYGKALTTAEITAIRTHELADTNTASVPTASSTLYTNAFPLKYNINYRAITVFNGQNSDEANVEYTS